MASKIKLFNKKLGVGKKHKSHIEVVPKAVVAPAQIASQVGSSAQLCLCLTKELVLGLTNCNILFCVYSEHCFATPCNRRSP